MERTIPESLKTEFFNLYGNTGNPPQAFFSPGRVNLIGEHTDYNGGFVLPCALQYGTLLLVRLNDTKQIKLASTNIMERQSFPSDLPFQKQKTGWFNYPLGVMDQFVKKGFQLQGMELLFSGDIPNNAGLSSSASIEMVTAFALNDLLNTGQSLIDLVKLSQKAENEFAGVNCGIMDQFASGMGQANHAIFLNCHTLEYKLIPLLIPGYKLVIANTNKRRGLADSKYNERVAECGEAVKKLSEIINIERLSDMSFMQFYKLQDQIADETIRRRARHVISENQRVLNSVSCLLKSDLLQFGALMNASHDSLRDNYEVTGFELDTLFDEARKINGVIGSRMTGAGFGGCTVTLIKDKFIDNFMKNVGEEYLKKTGLTPDFYIAEPGDGARKLIYS